MAHGVNAHWIFHISTTDDIAPQAYATHIIRLNKIDEYPLEKLNDTLVLHLKAEDKSISSQFLFDYINSLNYIKDSQGYILDKYNEYNAYTNSLMERWNKSYITFASILNNKSQSLPDAADHQFALWKNCLSEFEKSQCDSKGELKYTKVDTFLKSLMLKENVNLAAPFAFPLVNDCNSLIQEMIIIYENFKMNKKYSEIFNHSVTNWVDIRTKLIRVKNYYATHSINKL